MAKKPDTDNLEEVLTVPEQNGPQISGTDLPVDAEPETPPFQQIMVAILAAMYEILDNINMPVTRREEIKGGIEEIFSPHIYGV